MMRANGNFNQIISAGAESTKRFTKRRRRDIL